MCDKKCKRCGGGLPDWMIEDTDWLPEAKIVPPGENEVDCSIDNVRIVLADNNDRTTGTGPGMEEIYGRLGFIIELLELILDRQ